MPIDIPPLPFHALDQAPDEVAGRFAQALTRGTPRWLWPEVPVERCIAARREIVPATGEVLAGRRAALDAEIAAEAMGVAAFTMGMGPLLGYWVETGMLDAEPRTAGVLALHLAHGRARAARLAAVADALLGAFASAGVRATVVKGMHTARALFPDPGTRPMTDVDLVVAPGDIPAAEAALSAAGFVRRKDGYQRRPYHADWCPPGADDRLHSLLLSHRDNPLTLNLHDGFDRFAGRGRVALGTPGAGEMGKMPGASAPASTLAGPFLIAYLAAHAGEQRENLLLIRLVELVLAVRGTDPAVLRDFLHARRMAHHVHPALALAERLAPGTVDAELRAWLQAESGPRACDAVAALDLAMLQRLHERVAGGQALGARGPLDRVRTVLRWLVPYPSLARLREVYRLRWRHLGARLRAR